MIRVRLPIWRYNIDIVQCRDVISWIDKHREDKVTLLGQNLHSLYLCETDSAFRKLYQGADLVIADGFPIHRLATLNARKGDTQARPTRLGSVDWAMRLGDITDGLRIAIVGASPDSNRAAVMRLRDRFPHHEFRGWDGYGSLASLETPRIDELLHYRPNLVLVGMGMPKQERWLDLTWDRLPRAVYATVGGAIDQISGHQSLAPRWLGRFGLEWTWRLASDPRRLSHRYLVEPFKLAAATLRRRSIRND